MVEVLFWTWSRRRILLYSKLFSTYVKVSNLSLTLLHIILIPISLLLLSPLFVPIYSFEEDGNNLSTLFELIFSFEGCVNNFYGDYVEGSLFSKF